MMPLGSKLAPTQGSQAGTQEERKTILKFFSETGRHRDLIFGVSQVGTRAKGEQLQNFSSETGRSRALIFGK